MSVVLWIAAAILALAFLAAGASKLAQSREKLIQQTPYVQDFPHSTIRAIGVVEILGALGLILPAVVGVAPVLVPLAALGLALTMAGAVVVHLRRGDGLAGAAPAVVLGLVAVFVAWGRFGPYAF